MKAVASPRAFTRSSSSSRVAIGLLLRMMPMAANARARRPSGAGCAEDRARQRRTHWPRPQSRRQPLTASMICQTVGCIASRRLPPAARRPPKSASSAWSFLADLIAGQRADAGAQQRDRPRRGHATWFLDAAAHRADDRAVDAVAVASLSRSRRCWHSAGGMPVAAARSISETGV